ncbi:MAG: ABC transporter, partial [Thermoproteota archaeon]
MKEGEIVTIMGHTGCGKSTLCLTFNGIIPHAMGGDLKGKVVIDGLDIMEHDIPELARRVGMVFQDPETQLFSVTVKSEVAFGPENLMLPREEILERVRWALEATRLKGYEERAPTKLSGGEKQQVALAAAMAMRPRILVLDEPTSELDPVGTRKIFSLIKELNKKYGITFVIIEHKEEAIQLSDRIILMKEGRVIGQGKPSQVFSDIKSVKESRVRVPQISQLFYKLKERGLDLGRIPLTIEDAYLLLKDLLKEGKAEDIPVEVNKREKGSQPVIKTENLFFQYKNGPVALKGINLEVYQGEFVAIIGQNGAGKTTLAKHFNGLLKPTKGDVIIDGMNTKDALITDLAKTVGFVFQNPDHQFFSFTVEEEVAFGPRNLGLSDEEVKNRVDEALSTVGLEKMRQRHPFTLSRGQRQRLAVASVLAMHPKMIVLDEPTTGQDEVAINQIM